ncbi:TPA: hypothetical protein RI735_002132 [Vibrio cholerae]|nr:preprotein translocase subunit SecB [Vibrio cholerae]HDV5375294.1 hypothetical protein [Vibrio cholerae]HDV5386182.1 hypothetical protein [Vibrio cholerae]
MNDSMLKDAVSNLAIENIVLKEMTVKTHDDFDPDTVPEDIFLNGQSYRNVVRVQSFSVNDEDVVSLYRYTYSLGLRFIPTEQRVRHEAGEIEGDELEPYIEFTARFFADYHSEKELEKDSVDAFGEKHVGFHIWPYWRELIQSSCGRLGINSIVIPPYRINC